MLALGGNVLTLVEMCQLWGNVASWPMWGAAKGRLKKKLTAPEGGAGPDGTDVVRPGAALGKW